MSPRAKRTKVLTRAGMLTGDALRQAIREEIERQIETTDADVTQEVERPARHGEGAGPTPAVGFSCPDCPDSFGSQSDLLGHDIEVHLPERVAQADRRLSERKGGA